jgi:hypothetical protein
MTYSLIVLEFDFNSLGSLNPTFCATILGIAVAAKEGM